jgi:hypothetical protein
MKPLVVTMLVANLAAAAAPPAPPLRERLTDKVIKEAVQQTLAEKRGVRQQGQGTVLDAEKYENFSREFSEAKVPGCLRPDGLKFQPTFIFSGLLAAPFVLVAAVRGKCH